MQFFWGAVDGVKGNYRQVEEQRLPLPLLFFLRSCMIGQFTSVEEVLEEEIDLRPYVEALLRNWKWIIGAGILAALIALGGETNHMSIKHKIRNFLW
jgi:hypothetical protein